MINPPAPRGPSNRAFRRLTVITALAVYLLIVVGGIVRLTGSGLGCPDWPLCHGRVVPPPDMAAIIEYTHRVVAAFGGALMIATLIAAWRRHRTDRRVTTPITAAVGLLVVQVPLGGVIVATELEPLIVAFHLGMAMAIFGLVLLTAVAAHRPAAAPAAKRPYAWLTVAALGALFVLLLTGALVVGSDAQLACPEWPLCNGGRLLPGPNDSPLVAIHLLHRYTVASVSVLLLAVIGGAFRQARRGLRGWALALLALFAFQVGVGAVQVILQLPLFWRAMHLAAASGVWGALVIIVGQAAPALSAARSAARGPVEAAAGAAHK